MNPNCVTLSIQQNIAYVTLNRPDKHNALDMAMFRAMTKVIQTIKKNKRVRVVIVNGEGASFCSGLDVKSVLSSPVNGVKLLWKWLPGNPNLAQKVVVGWRQLNVPVIMVIHGKCWGGGMQIALGGDFRIASPDASLSIMESKWGLIPDMGGTLALKENVSVDQAMQLAMTAETISAEKAKQLGLVSHISDSPIEYARSLAQQLIERSPDTNRSIKQFYHRVWCRQSRRILAAETWNQWKILLGKNQKIAVKKAKGESLEYR